MTLQRRATLGVVLVLAVLAAAGGATPARASQIISTYAVSNLSLGVNGKGEAMVTYTIRGKIVHVLAWGALNATAPGETSDQVRFRLGYDGGYRKLYVRNGAARAELEVLRKLQARLASARAERNRQARRALAPRIADSYARLARFRSAAANYWRTFSCPVYDGPALAFRVAACRAPDGSSWAVQSWPRKLPNYGVPPTPFQAALEVHLSHWTGELPVVRMHLNWAYRRFDHLFGTYSYQGKPVHGFRSTSQGQPLDRFGRNIYLDTFDSAYGPGWRRENSFLSHNPGGTFCYGFYRHGSYPAGKGTSYRATMLGPGVAPDVRWEGLAPGPYDPNVQRAANAEILGLHDPLCTPV